MLCVDIPGMKPVKPRLVKLAISFIILTVIIVALKSSRRKTNTKTQLVADTVHNVSVKHVDFRAGENKPIKHVRKGARTRQEHVVLLNLEQGGPSAIDQILYRFSVNNNLTFTRISSENTSNASEYTSLNQSDAVDILSVYCTTDDNNKKFKPDATKVVILKEPMSSVASKVHSLLKTNRSWTHYPVVDPHESRLSLIQRDSMAECLAVEKDLKSPMGPNIVEWLEALRKQFRLILLQERLEESLILLRRTLGWSLIDVLFIERNINSFDLELSSKEEGLFRAEHYSDIAVYEFFSKIFDQQIEAQEADFDEEVSHFRIILTQLLGYCNQRTTPTEHFPIEATVWHGDIFISWKHCNKFEVRYHS